MPTTQAYLLLWFSIFIKNWLHAHHTSLTYIERKTGFEPATSTLARSRSTN